MHLSNTFYLIESYSEYTELFIEGDEEKYKDLLKTCEKYPNIIPHCAYVDPDNKSNNSLDKILKYHNFPEDLLLLSIDIDSCNYHVFKTLDKFRPIIVIIEIDSCVSPINEESIYDGEKYEGASFMPTLLLGINKEYTLICHTGNLIFIRDDYLGFVFKFKPTIQDYLNMFKPNRFYAHHKNEFNQLYR